MERRIAGSLRVVLVGDGRAEERHDPVARVLVDGSLEAVDAVRQDLEEAIQDAVPLLGSTDSASSSELLTSANRMVTCLRSPSRADFEARIFSARCLGV
jgi:hypothetical protein